MGLITRYRATVAVLALSLVLTACGSDSTNTAIPSPSPTPTATPTPTPTPEPTPTPTPKPTQTPKLKPAKPRCVGTFQNEQFTLRATGGGGIYGSSFSCGGQDNYVMAEQLQNAIRFYVAANTATIRPGQTVAIGGYNIKVRLIKGSTAVFEVTPR
ncbi:hypothetical protein OG394_37995 [Kribbella sp. NBC_01245]|uniref:hypothetical protein n=1 Tax=Kribbella sp. NBC_01245 TaxID=2903578 RepID=UPI002E2CEEDE|nr:hypothetical protein [Kribbella sp. NBC_01245]